MKLLITTALVAGGLMFATSNEASAHDYFRRGRSGFGVSLNFGSPYGYRSGISYNRGYNYGFGGPIRSRSFTRVTPRRYIQRSYYSGPTYGGFGYGGYGYGGFGGCGF